MNRYQPNKQVWLSSSVSCMWKKSSFETEQIKRNSLIGFNFDSITKRSSGEQEESFAIQRRP